MRTWMLLAAGVGLAVGGDAGRAQHREAGAHEHGRGTLNIALEGSRLSMELEAPGADIVGFEHEAGTPQQASAVEAARRRLAAPQGLFELPPSAGCVLRQAKVAIEAEGHEATVHGDKEHAGSEHSAFRAEYAFDCEAPSRLTAIGFGYFKAFSGARRLDVTVITPRQQSRFEVSRAKPRLDLAGMM